MDTSVENLAECPVCMEWLTYPKFLPCLHTFCCKCIEDLCSDRLQGRVPCPLCRSEFDAPGGGRCSKLPTNVYADELVRVSGILEQTHKDMRTLKNKLEETKNARQKAIDEKRRLDMTLAESTTALAQLKETYQKAKAETEASLTQEKQACHNIRQQLQQMERETCEQLKDAERLREAAKAEVEICKKAKADIEAFLTLERQACHNLRQQLQQMEGETRELLKDADMTLASTTTTLNQLKQRSIQQKQQMELRLVKLKRKLSGAESREHNLNEKYRNIREQLQDAERRHYAAKSEAEIYLKAKAETEASLTQEKQACHNLRQQLQQMEQETYEQLEDAKRRHESAEIEAETCKVSLAQEKQLSQDLREQLNDANCQQEKAKIEAETCRRAKNNIEVSLVEAKQSYQSRQQEIIEQAKMLKMELGQSEEKIIRLKADLYFYCKSRDLGRLYIFCFLR